MFLPPANRLDPIRRSIFLGPDVFAGVVGPWPNEQAAIRGKALRAYLDRFTVGDTIPICLEPYIARTAYLGRLHPERNEVWDIRSTYPSPGLRIFGRFADVDVFVGLICRERLPLGDRNSPEWKWLIGQCKTDWRNLFPAHNAVFGGDIHDYISTNVIHI